MRKELKVVKQDSDDEIIHYGVGHLNGGHSGRYAWGSGKEPYKRATDFMGRVNELKKNGKSDAEIAEIMGIMHNGNPSSTRLRIQVHLAGEELRSEKASQAIALREKGLSLQAIAERMGYNNDSSIRSLLNAETAAKKKQAQNTADFLIDQVNKKGMIDVGKGVEKELGISREKLDAALYIAELQGYPTYGGGVAQATNPGKQTNIKVLCTPGTQHKDIYNFENIHEINDMRSYDGGDTFKPSFVYPESLDSKRLQIVYAEQGGTLRDGLIEVRRGCPDLDLGNSNYAQVRIAVDNKSYLKGMCVYADDLPPGIDVRFNTNKSSDKSVHEVLKPLKKDPLTGEIDKDNPFGSLIKEKGGQSYYIDPKTGKEKLSLINKRAEEGDWNEWADKLPSQFLVKQSKELIKRQLDITMRDKQAEFEEICQLTNPTVKKKLLYSFADDCDSAAVHLKAAALPRQKYQVLLPLTTLKDGEIYAPNYKDGEKVALVRFPHAGIFEIPILTVNNRNNEGRKMIGKNPKDGVGISQKTAEQLSGADFDGDTALVVPTAGNGRNMNIRIASKSPLKELEGFDNKLSYGHDREWETVDPKTGKVEKHYSRGGIEFKAMKTTGIEMGKISNLITDMTLKGAQDSEIARAVRHSMVVIDAEKHGLDYTRSFKENRIQELKDKYQGEINPETGKYGTGAGTILSRAKGKAEVIKRKGSPKINPETGDLEYKEVVEKFIDPKTGKERTRKQNSTRMAEVKDAYELVSKDRDPKELLYADFANFHKNLARKARLEYLNTPRLISDAKAKKKYEAEVKSLDEKLLESEKNAPKERKAQMIANAKVKAQKDSNPDMTKGELRKISQRALKQAREAVGAKRVEIDITEKEWEAIQSGAISDSKLSRILTHANTDQVRNYATPKNRKGLSDAQLERMKIYKNNGYTNAQIADILGCSSSSVSKYLSE